MVKIHMMKAYEGDFIWLSYGDMEKEYHLLIDGGVKECRQRYADVIKTISAKGESIEAIILRLKVHFYVKGKENYVQSSGKVN